MEGGWGAFVEKPPRERRVSSKAGETEAKQVARVPGINQDVSYKARVCKVGAKQHLKHKPLITLLATGKARHLPRQMHRRNVLGCGAGTLVHTTLGGVRQAERGGGAPCISLSLSPQASQPRLGRKPLQPGTWSHSSLYFPRKCNHSTTPWPDTEELLLSPHSKCLCELQTGSSHSKSYNRVGAWAPPRANVPPPEDGGDVRSLSWDHAQADRSLLRYVWIALYFPQIKGKETLFRRETRNHLDRIKS